jgi:TRAP-type C4-dicarboxylate transport system permease small subunit
VSEQTEATGSGAESILEDVSILRPQNFFDKTIIGFFSLVCFTMSALLTVLISAATLMRYVLQVDLYGYEEWVKLFAFWLYFCGAGYGAFNRSHITADLVQAYIPKGNIKRFVTFLRDLVTFCVTSLFLYYGYDFFMFGFRGPLGTGVAIPMTTIWRIPLWTSYLAITMGLFFMVWYFGVALIQSAKALVKGEDA